jgi:hypothetical protein
VGDLLLHPGSGRVLGGVGGLAPDAQRFAATGPFTGGLVLTTVGLIVLLDLPWRRVWPVFLIVGGIGALLPTLLRAARRSNPE